jgi:hypothetical protein
LAREGVREVGTIPAVARRNNRATVLSCFLLVVVVVVVVVVVIIIIIIIIINNNNNNTAGQCNAIAMICQDALRTKRGSNALATLHKPINHHASDGNHQRPEQHSLIAAQYTTWHARVQSHAEAHGRSTRRCLTPQHTAKSTAHSGAV